MSRFRNCCVTFNNYPENFDVKTLEPLCNYYVIGKEIGESGTPHLQCYLELKKQTRLKSVQVMFKSKVHVERRKGTAQQASKYCMKDGNFVTYGTISNPGKRTDISSLREAVKAGKSVCELYDEHDAMWKYHRAAKDYKLHLDMQEKQFTPMEVICLIGPPGSGKTRLANTMDPDIFHVPSCEPLWFDGYSGEKTILFDDYYGALKWGKLLQLLDGYRFSVPVKGGFVWKKWTKVIITSNALPKCWYQTEDYTALERRITEIKMVGYSITPTSETVIES